MTYTKEQRKKFLIEYIDRLSDNLEIKPWREWLIELRDALDIEIFTYRDKNESNLYWESLSDLIK